MISPFPGINPGAINYLPQVIFSQLMFPSAFTHPCAMDSQRSSATATHNSQFTIHKMADSQEIHDALIREVIFRLYDESLPRIVKCLGQLDDDQIWWRPNASSNSIGNLVLHLCGNVRQWIYSGLGAYPDGRDRQSEFDETGPIDRETLILNLISTMELIRPVISSLSKEELLRRRQVQTFQETGLTILIHVTEHFSYHTGQIGYITKMLLDRPLGYYGGIALE
ncbi:MAG: DinB family protein [Saprospiraceae bacterium]